MINVAGMSACSADKFELMSMYCFGHSVLVMGSILGIRRAALVMAAGMSVGRSPFLRVDAPRNNKRGDEDEKSAIEDMKKQRILDERKALFAKVGNSDHSLLGKTQLEIS